MDFQISIVELTVEAIARQVGYLIFYRNNFEKLMDQVEELQEMKERIDHVVEVERRNGREIKGDVLRWQKSVIQTLEEAKKLYEDSHYANAGFCKWPFLNLESRVQQSKKAKNMANTIFEMKAHGNFDEGVGYIPRKTFLVTGESVELESRSLIEKNIVLSLKDPKISIIGIYGIGGVGKTTLVQKVAKRVMDDKLFDAVVMVTISEITNLERIQDEIAAHLGLHFNDEVTLAGRALCLSHRIKMEKSILIILDDLWEKIYLDELGIPSLYKGCKLLLTSRSQNILRWNEIQKIFSLQVLNAEESWRLLKAMVGDVVKDANLLIVATRVAQGCAGLPTLIIEVARSLKHSTDINDWEYAWKSLERVDNRDTLDTLFSAVEFSINRLEEEVKKVFLLCGLHGTSILVSHLLKYVLGLGIIKWINTIEEARWRLYKIIDDLKASSLLLDDVSAEMIKMHDLVRETAVSVASEYVFTKSNVEWQDWPRNDILERCTHIILDRCCIQKLPERLDCPHLTFLYINSTDNRTLEIPDSFFEGMRNLEVLDLTGIIIASLPISLSFLTKLKTLCLDQCSLKNMTGIGALINLEILSLVHSSIEEFPREIEQLAQLRMLDLSKSRIETAFRNIWFKLTKIEELYMGDTTINWEVESSTMQKRNASLADLGHLICLTTLEFQIRDAWLLPNIPFGKLKRYKVVIGDKWEWPANEETSRFLKISADDITTPFFSTKVNFSNPETLKLSSVNLEKIWDDNSSTPYLVRNLANLTVENCSSLKYLFSSSMIGRLSNLKQLEISKCDMMEEIIAREEINKCDMMEEINSAALREVFFPKVEAIIIKDMQNLRTMWHPILSSNSLACFKTLKVKNCEKIENIFPEYMNGAVASLEVLKVKDCKSVQEIFQLGFNADDTTKLKNIQLLRLPQLKQIWSRGSQSTLRCKNLQVVHVEDCEDLEYLFPFSIAKHLPPLEEITIKNAEKMKGIVSKGEEPLNNPVKFEFN